MTYPRPIEAGNTGDGAPLTLGDPAVIGDAFLTNGEVNLFDWDGDGRPGLVDSGSAVFTYRFVDQIADGTPLVDRGQRLGEMSRSHQRDENDTGLCGRILAHGDFDGDGYPEIILGPRGYSKRPIVVVRRGEDGWPDDGAAGATLHIEDPAAPGDDALAHWAGGPLCAFDWNGDGRQDLVVAIQDMAGYHDMDPETGHVAVDQRDRYTRDGRWRGRQGDWSLHLLRNECTPDAFRFVYAGAVELSEAPPGGPMAPVDPADPTAGLLVLGYYGEVFHLPLTRAGDAPQWGDIA